MGSNLPLANAGHRLTTFNVAQSTVLSVNLKTYPTLVWSFKLLGQFTLDQTECFYSRHIWHISRDARRCMFLRTYVWRFHGHALDDSTTVPLTFPRPYSWCFMENAFNVSATIWLKFLWPYSCRFHDNMVYVSTIMWFKFLLPYD